MAAGLQRILQQDFSGGMFSSLAPELIPADGAFDITNGLLNEEDVVYRRGGSAYFSAAPVGGDVRLLWAGTLKNGGQQTVLVTSTTAVVVHGDGSLAPVALPIPGALTPGVVFQGRLFVGGYYFDGSAVNNDARGSRGATAYAVAGNRLVAAEGSKIVVSNVPKTEGEAIAWTEETNFLRLPEGVTVTGMAGWRTSVVVFTTRGIYIIGGLEHAEITDEAGNGQWTQDRYSADAQLWGAPGVAAWKGGLVVPCKDDVWLMELGVSSERAAPFRSVSKPIQALYRGYVARGYTPGAAVVFNGHYFLPVMSGANVVDLLVCRLEGVNAQGRVEPAWTHLQGYGARVSALVAAVSDLEGPLLGATAGAARLLRLSYFAPGFGAPKDADGSDIAFELTTRSIPTGGLVPNLVAKARLSYRMAGSSPATRVTMGFGTNPYGGSEWGNFDWGEGTWTAPTGPFADLGEALPTATADPEALVPRVWHPRRKVRYARMRIALNGSAALLSIRALELFVRADGRLI